MACWLHQTIINVDLSPKVFCGIHLRATSQVLINLICNECGDYTFSNYNHIFQGPMS